LRNNGAHLYKKYYENQQIKAVCFTFTLITCALKYGFLKNVLLVNASR